MFNIEIRAVKSINRIQNKSLCLDNVCTVYMSMYI